MAVPAHIRAAVLAFNGKGLRSNSISRILKTKYNFVFSGRGIRKFLCKESVRLTSKNTKRKVNRKFEDLHLQYINFSLKRNPNVTASEIKRKLLEIFGLTVSVSQIKFHRQKLGWTSRQTGYCQMISEKNQRFRKKWCLYMLSTKEDFHDVIFTDETSVEMCSPGSLTFYSKASSIESVPSRAPKPKHSYKVHVWGGISYRGRTNICIFTGIMDSASYPLILQDNLLPFTKETFPDGFLLYQDNDSKHKSQSTKQWMAANDVNVMTAPASSPDINPIENVWAAMKDYLRRCSKPKTKEELVCGIRQFWSMLTPETCGTYIDHIHKVIPVTVLNNGGASGY